jgi:hypothetical protein
MKRLILCAVAVLLTAGALASGPAFACTSDPQCDPFDCQLNCAATGHHTGTCSTCTGRCTCS